MNNFLLGFISFFASGVVFASEIGKISCDFGFIPKTKIGLVDPDFGMSESFDLDWISMPDRNSEFTKRIELKNIVAEVRYTSEAFDVNLFRPVTNKWLMTGTVLPLPLLPPTNPAAAQSWALGTSQAFLLLDLPIEGEATFECSKDCQGSLKFVYDKISVWCTGILKPQ